MARVLLYNFTDETRRKKIGAILFQYMIPLREVRPEEQGHPLGYLLGVGTYGPAENREEPFANEMIVMHDLTGRQFHGLLDGMKRAGLAVPLKAVVTETNIGWSSERLRRELAAEHEAMSGGKKQKA